MVNDEIQVFMIEDNLQDVLFLNEILEESFGKKFKISSAETLKEGLKQISKGKFDVILLDLGLPDSNGFETFAETQKITPDIPIIILTGLSDEKLARKAVRNGAQDYLLKNDIDSQVLSKAIHYAIERKKAEMIRKESEERYHSLFDNMLNGLAYCKMIFKNNKPSDFIYLDVNKSFETLTGLKDVVGKKVTEVIPGIKESDPELFEIYGRVALTGEPEVFEMLVESLEDWFSVSVYSPQKEYFVAVFDVITERKKAEESLKESEEKYRLVIETAGEAIGIFDKNGKTIEVNQKMLELTGFKREELIGENLIETPKIKINLKQALTTFKDVTSGQTISNSEWDFTNLKGEDKTVIAHYTPRIKNGKLNGITLILENITELKRSEREILKSLGEKESLLREIHHRVNNNFQIISSLYNLQMEMVGTDCHDIIMASQSRIKSMAMVHEKVYQSTDLVHINYKQYIEKLLSDLFYMYGVEPGKIKTIMDIEDIQMGIDTAIPLGLIINELIVNSIRYAFPHANKGHIEVELKSNDDQYQLKIADDGVGLPENIDFKHPKTLGLQLVNTLISQIDGIVTLDNTNGTEFKIIFKESKYKERINQPY